MEGVATLQAPAQRGESHVANVLLVMNPGARGSRRALSAVVAAFDTAGVPCEVVETRAPGHATELVRERLGTDLDGVDAVFTLGGDGTAMEGATALPEHPGSPPLGILAGGKAHMLGR